MTVIRTLSPASGEAISIQAGFFGEGKGMIWLDDLDCRGNETKLVNCPHRGFGTTNCQHFEDASVLCPGLIQ